VPLTTDPGVQQMPSVAVDPHDPSHLVVATMDYALRKTGYAGIGVQVSHDGGATWQRTAVPLPAGFDEGAAQPIAQFDGQGRVFVTYMASTFLGPHQPGITNPSNRNPVLHVRERTFGYQSNNGIFVVRSDDGGLTWDQPVAVTEHLYDGTDKVPYEIMPYLAIDTFATLPDGRPNPNYGTLYDVWARYYAAGRFPGQPTATGGSQLFFAVSHDGGQTWQVQLKQPPGSPFPVTVIDTNPDTGIGLPEGTGYSYWSKVTVGPQGDVYVADSDAGYFGVYHSTDGGKTFTAPDPATLAGYPFGVTNNTLPGGTLKYSRFRTIGVRDIVADPTRPGTLYIADELAISDSAGDPLDEGDIIFARSTDDGATWQTTFQVGTHVGANVLNDDNDGFRATGSPDDVTDGQALPQLAIDTRGDLAVLWYDTRRDPADTRLDVYGTVSSDGGRTFSPNFRVTDQSFDPNAGSFIDAEGRTDFYLGDALGLAVVDGTAYAAWTDTLGGNQDVYFSSYAIDPPPAPPSNRFASNATAATATDLGPVVTRSLPKLTIAAGGEEWFQFHAAATGNLTITATLAVPADGVRLELYGADGTTLLASGTALSNGSDQGLTFPGQSGQTYLVRVLPGPAAAAGVPAEYVLDVQSLTANLGTQVDGTQGGTLAAGQDAYYALSVPAAGSLEVTLTPGANAQGNFHLEVLDPKNLTTPLASGQTAGSSQYASAAVKAGQATYLHVFGDAGTRGAFTLTFTNLDQFTTPDHRILNFPLGGGPSQAVLADLRHNGLLDVVVSHLGANVVSVLLNNGDGTFQAPRDYAVGAFQAGGPATLTGVNDYRRDLAVADLNGDGIPDLVVVNHDSGDLSILFGRGDGTFAPEQRVAATTAPMALAVGDVNGDGVPDLVVADSTAGPIQGVVLLSRGDGTFAPPIPLDLPPDTDYASYSLRLADFNGDGKLDIVFNVNVSGTVLLLGHGDGTFGPPVAFQPRNSGPGLAVADLNGDGKLDVVTTAFDHDDVSYSLGNGDGTFQPVQDQDQIQGGASVGRAPVAVAVADFGSARADGSLGPPDGLPDLILADAGLRNPTYSGPPEVVLLPGQADGHGNFTGFRSPIPLAFLPGPIDVKAGDLDGNGTTDVVVVDSDGVAVIYGKSPALPPDNTPQTARNLGSVVHVLDPAQTIVPGHEDAYYTLAVPAEAARGAGDEVLDFSGLFRATAGAGLSMEVRDAAGNLFGSGERFRVVVPQGTTLLLHVFGVPAADGSRGAGAYTLDIDTLPQLASVEAQPLLPGPGAAPGGPTASLVLTFQGDRLDPAAAQDPANYTVTWLGPDGVLGTADDRVVPVDAAQGAVYDPSTNVDVASGTVYPTAVRQTVTLLFDQPLPPGSYHIDVSAAVQAAAFNEQESALLSAVPGFTGHPVVSADGGQVSEGSRRTATDLVFAEGALGDLGAFQAGTPFLTQLHDDLGALLDAGLTQQGDDPALPGAIDGQILGRFAPALGPADQRPVAVLVLWLDPPPISLVDPQGQRVVYNPQDRSYQDTFRQGFVSVAGNVEVLVLPFVPTASQDYLLTVTGASATARGGAVYLGRDGSAVTPLTAALRGGTTQFRFSFGPAAVSVLLADAPPTAAATEAAIPAVPPAQPATGGTGSAGTTAGTAPAGASLSPVAPLVSLDTRQRTALVIVIAPHLDGPAPATPGDPGRPASPAVAADSSGAAALSGGGGGEQDEPGAGVFGPLRSLLARVGRPFLQAASRVGGVLEAFRNQLRGMLRALDAAVPAGNNPPVPGPREPEEPPPDQPEEEAGLPPLGVNGNPESVLNKAGARADLSRAVALALAGAGAAWGAACGEPGRAGRKKQPGNEEPTDA
jgi:hypothetical protein